jgi:hypothetical protein
MVFGIKIIKIFCKQKNMANMAGYNRQTSSTKMSKCNWTNELINDLIDLVEEREVIWNAKAKVYHDKDKRNGNL